MKILITNDDGINSPVLPKLAEWAKTKGEVFVVAPKVEQSGKSHGINIIDKIEIIFIIKTTQTVFKEIKNSCKYI